MAKPQPKRSKQLVTGGDPEGIYPEIPNDTDFKKADCDYVEAEDLQKIGAAIIETQGGFGYLRDRKIVYLWKKKGGTRGGKAVLGKCQRPAGLLAKFCDADWIVWLAADHHAAFRSTRFQIEATVFHELCHTDVDEETEEALLVSHDYEGFCREVELYGAWKGDLEKAARSFQQLNLF